MQSLQNANICIFKLYWRNTSRRWLKKLGLQVERRSEGIGMRLLVYTLLNADPCERISYSNTGKKLSHFFHS